MPNTKAISASLTAVALTLASPALAVTADELWAEWQTRSGAMGQTITADSVTPGDGTLTLSGFSSSFSDGEVSTIGRVDQIVMTENPDGSVGIEMSDTYALSITFVPDRGVPPVTIGINMMSPDLTITASGDAGARVYDYAASRITIEEGAITGGDGPPPTIDLMIGMEDLAATYQIDGTDPDNMAYASSSTIGALTGAVDILPPPGEVGQLKLAFAIGPSTSSGEGRLGNLTDLASNPELVPAGFDVTGDLTYDSASVEMTFAHPRDAFSLFASNDGGSFSASMSEAEVDYRITATGSSTYLAGAEIPVPVDFSVGNAEIAFRIPLAESPDPQPVAARLAYEDVLVSPELWAMADPTQSFPRDPVTVIADLSGTVRVLASLMEMGPDAMGAPPAELRDLTLNELRLSVGGATLTGTGSADFAPGPIPMPVGSVDLQLSGGNALLDTLQGIGVIPIEQLAMVRGMLGAFARPGATPDTLESTIEFTEGGGITANGVPLQ